MNTQTEMLTKKLARDLAVGDRVKLGNQWRRVFTVESSGVPTDDEINGLVVDVVNAHNGDASLNKAAHALYVATDRRARWPEPYVKVLGGSATSTYEAKFHPDEIVDVVVAKDDCPRCGGGGEVAGFDYSGPGIGICPVCKGTGKAAAS